MRKREKLHNLMQPKEKFLIKNRSYLCKHLFFVSKYTLYIFVTFLEITLSNIFHTLPHENNIEKMVIFRLFEHNFEHLC